jgi:hypothetical protein
VLAGDACADCRSWLSGLSNMGSKRRAREPTYTYIRSVHQCSWDCLACGLLSRAGGAYDAVPGVGPRRAPRAAPGQRAGRAGGGTGSLAKGWAIFVCRTESSAGMTNDSHLAKGGHWGNGCTRSMDGDDADRDAGDDGDETDRWCI